MSSPRAWQCALVASTLLGYVSAAVPYLGTPYEARSVELPGRLQAEFFDLGGQGVAFNNIEAPGEEELPENVIRVEEDGLPMSVQINDVSTVNNPAASEPAGAMAVGMITSGEWLRFTVDVPVGGYFVPQWRLAAFSPEGADVPVSTKVKLPTLLIDLLATSCCCILLKCTNMHCALYHYCTLCCTDFGR
jgi:hypothetical protein